MGAVKTLLPRLRFPEFQDSGEWEEKQLGKHILEFRQQSTIQDEFEVLTSAQSGLIRQKDYFDNDQIAERDNIGFNVIPPDYLTYRSRSDNRRFYFNENNLDITGIISVYYPVFRIVDGSNKFFVELFSHYSKVIGKHSVGTSQTVLSLNELRRIKLPIPREAEQQKIADCLTSLDELITAQSQKVDALQAYKKGLMQNLFPAEGESVPRLRFPEFESAGEWELQPLGTVAENLDNFRVPITESNRVKGEIPYYGASGIIDYVNDFIFDEDLLCISEDGANLIARTYSIAFSISGKSWVNNHAHVLRFENKSKQIILENYLNFINLEDYLTGMAQPKLNRTMLDDIPIPLPNIEEQQRIAELLTAIDEQIIAQSETVEMLKSHKKGLMQGLFPSMDVG